jgi:hypothetical protein
MVSTCKILLGIDFFSKIYRYSFSENDNMYLPLNDEKDSKAFSLLFLPIIKGAFYMLDYFY